MRVALLLIPILTAGLLFAACDDDGDTSPVETAVVQIGFRPDNLRMLPDGSMLAAGHTDFQLPTEGFNVARVDPDTLEFSRILQHPFIDGFAAATTAMQVGNELWLGTNRGGMIGYLPAP